MKVELTVVGIRNYCGGEEGYPALFARLPIGSEVVLRTNRTGDPFPGAVSVYDMEMQKIGSIAKTDRRFIELEIPKDGVLYAKVIGHSVIHNCIYLEAENTKGIKEPYLRVSMPESDELVFAKTAQDERMECLTDAVKSQVEALKAKNVTQPQMKSLVSLLSKYTQVCCTSLDGESSFKRADIMAHLRDSAKEHAELQPFYDDILEQSKDLCRIPNDVKVQVYRQQYEAIYASAMAKGKNGKSQVDEWIETLKFTHGGVLTKGVISEEMNRLANKLSVELMNKYVSCIDSDESFATALYSLNYRLRSIYVLYTRRIKYNYLKDMLYGNDAGTPNAAKPTEKPVGLPLPSAINTKRAQTYFQKAIEQGFIEQNGDKLKWIPIGGRGDNTQLAYFCGLVFGYKHSAYGNTGDSFPEKELNSLFEVNKMYATLTQAHRAKKKQAWRRKIDELFE